MRDSDNVDELYEWINSRYEQYSEGEIEEDEYLSDLEYYKKRLAELETEESKEEETQLIEEEKDSISPKKVRSTSIAGLRKKLMEEMRK